MQTRRDILIGSATAALSSLIPSAHAQTATQRVRYGATTSNGKAMLEIYAEGVKRMKVLQAKNPRAWDFQWYVHATPTDKAQLIKTVFGATAPSDPNRKLAEEAWYTCQPHQRGQAVDYFLPWHRLYVLQFEEIIRAITGQGSFTLPYWDYTNPNSYAIPVEFQTRSSTDPRFASLYVRNRNTSGGQLNAADVNAGEPLNKNFPGRRNFLVLPDLDNLDYSSFCSQLNQNLHGNVHVYTGDQQNMGWVPTAARDPVFWLHHCNIDRIWASWNVKGVNPTETNGKSWKDTSFVFADAKGDRIAVAISTVASSATLPYRYDTLPGQPATITVTENQESTRASPQGRSSMATTILRSGPARAGASTMSVAPGNAERIPLGAAPQTVRLSPTKPEARLQSVAPEFRDSAPQRLVLTLNDVQAAADPGTTYEVFLDLPPNAGPEAKDRHFVGLLNFFGIGGHGDHGGHGGQTVEFDVTKVVGQLGAQNALGADTSVTLIPVGTPAQASNPVVAGGIELKRR